MVRNPVRSYQDWIEIEIRRIWYKLGILEEDRDRSSRLGDGEKFFYKKIKKRRFGTDAARDRGTGWGMVILVSDTV